MASGSEVLAQAVEQQIAVLTQSGSDEDAAVQAAATRFDSALAKSDKLADDDDSAGAKRKRDNTLLEEARLNAARARLAAITAQLTAVSVAQLSASGAASRSAPSTSAAVDDEDSAEEKLGEAPEDDVGEEASEASFRLARRSR